MKVHVITYTEGSQTSVQAVMRSSHERAVERAVELARDTFDEDPSRTDDGWYMDTIETDVDTFVAIVDGDGNCVETFDIYTTEMEEEDQ